MQRFYVGVLFQTIQHPFPVAAPLSVEIEAHPNEYVIGEDLQLFCFSDSGNDVTVTWFKNSKPVRYEDSTRILNLEDGEHCLHFTHSLYLCPQCNLDLVLKVTWRSFACSSAMQVFTSAKFDAEKTRSCAQPPSMSSNPSLVSATPLPFHFQLSHHNSRYVVRTLYNYGSLLDQIIFKGFKHYLPVI